jgi:hypothetical protein
VARGRVRLKRGEQRVTTYHRGDVTAIISGRSSGYYTMTINGFFGGIAHSRHEAKWMILSGHYVNGPALLRRIPHG